MVIRYLQKLRKRIVSALLAHGISIPAAYVEKYTEWLRLKDLIEEASIDCVLDVGANIGQFARDLRLIGYRGWIVSFEPLSDAFNILEREFAGDTHWVGMQIALGNAEGTADFNIGCDTKYSSLLEFKDKNEVARTEKITIRRLDNVLPELDIARQCSRFLLKMDTQGYDTEVFAGAEGSMPKIAAIMSEVSVIPIYKGMKDYTQALELYDLAGFKLYHISNVSRSRENLIVEMNCLLRRLS